MASRQYDKLEIDEFGHHLITNGDLDPVYLALINITEDKNWVKRFLLAYWCSYHVGVSCYLADQSEAFSYWNELMLWAENDEALCPVPGRWPRGQERRHARGKLAVEMVTRLKGVYGSPEQAVDKIACLNMEGVLPCAAVMKRVKDHYMFGDWIAFKVADMAYNVLGAEIDFDQAGVFMFKDPREGAKRFWRAKMGLPENAEPKDEAVMIDGVVNHLVEVFKDLKAPPLYDRPIGILEVETVLCKWKSHLNGHYPLFNDTLEIHAGLEPWHGVSGSAKAFSDAMPGQDKR